MGQTLIGRGALIRRLHESLNGPHRLLSIVGPAGVGKTALIEAARVEPIAWDVGSARSAEETLGALAISLGVEAVGPAQLQHLGEALEALGERWLWVDHADRWQASILEWLEGWWLQAPALKVLWTGRLHLPKRFGPPLIVEPLNEADALALFALRASPTGHLPDAWAEDAAKLTRRLGGLPLAVEMAASWTTLLTPAELLRRAEPIEPWLLYSPTPSEGAERLRGAVAWSWSLLTAPQRQLALSCATRPAGALLEDLEGVAEALGIAHDKVASTLHSLRSHSLLSARLCPWTGRQRLVLYEPVRAFLSGQTDRDALAIAELNTELLVERAEQHALNFVGTDPLGAVRWLQAERPNLLHAMDRERHPRPEWAARAALALAPLLNTRGPWSTHHRILRDALICAEASRLEMLIAKVACALGSGLTLHGHFAAADQVLRGSYEALAGPGASQCTAHSLLVHAHVLGWLDEDDRARRMLSRAARLLDAVESGGVEHDSDCVHLSLQRAFLSRRVGTSEALHEAHGHIERATAEADAKSLRRLGHLCRYIRGQILLDLDRPEEAYASLQAAAEGLVEIGETCSEATVLQWMARAARCMGDIAHAESLLEQGIALARQRADLESEVYLQAEWVEHHLSQQQVDAARQALRQTRHLAARSLLPPARRLPEELQRHLDRLETLSDDIAPEAQIHLSRDASGWRYREEDVSLQARPTLRRVLACLCEARERRPGQMLDRETVFAAGWPGESILPRSRHQRVYTAIWTLRRLGLGDALLSDDNGYALCPARTVLTAP